MQAEAIVNVDRYAAAAKPLLLRMKAVMRSHRLGQVDDLQVDRIAKVSFSGSPHYCPVKRALPRRFESIGGV